MFGTYSIALWDHEAETFSDELATEFLERPAKGLSPRELSQSIRTLRCSGWDSPSMYVEREDMTGLTAGR